jgi:hypothetical protein
MSEPVPVGAVVRYHGSLSGRSAFDIDRGDYVPVDSIEFKIIRSDPETCSSLSDDGHRYIITPVDLSITVGPDNCYLNVRRQSFTLVSET